MAYTYIKHCRLKDKLEDIHVNLVRKSHTLLSRRVLVRVVAGLEGTYLRARGSFPRIRSTIYEFGLVENAVVFRGWRRARLRWGHRSIGSRGIGRHPEYMRRDLLSRKVDQTGSLDLVVKGPEMVQIKSNIVVTRADAQGQQRVHSLHKNDTLTGSRD